MNQRLLNELREEMKVYSTDEIRKMLLSAALAQAAHELLKDVPGYWEDGGGNREAEDPGLLDELSIFYAERLLADLKES